MLTLRDIRYYSRVKMRWQSRRFANEAGNRVLAIEARNIYKERYI